MGSCFAQHISKHIQRTGLTYFVTETADGAMPDDEARRRNYGVFSARYGNVYTVRQALQLFERAFDGFEPHDTIWQWGDRYVDALRPQVEPDGFASPEDVQRARKLHLAAVRRMFELSDVIVFTLGLTETFASRDDGTVYPVAPGVHGGSFAPDRYQFVNFTAAEVTDDLNTFVLALQAVNPRCRILLTVSPVPLIATYEARSVLMSNTVSKARLRVAADMVTSGHDHVDYFPSYEIIAGSADGAGYFETDLRQVRQRGVDHVMRIFGRHYIDQTGASRVTIVPGPEQVVRHHRETTGVVCDEELIAQSLRISGL